MSLALTEFLLSACWSVGYSTCCSENQASILEMDENCNRHFNLFMESPDNMKKDVLGAGSGGGGGIQGIKNQQQISYFIWWWWSISTFSMPDSLPACLPAYLLVCLYISA